MTLSVYVYIHIIHMEGEEEKEREREGGRERGHVEVTADAWNPDTLRQPLPAMVAHGQLKAVPSKIV